jgi:hypothetical protein
MVGSPPCDPDPLGLGLGLILYWIPFFLCFPCYLHFVSCFLHPLPCLKSFKNSTKIHECFLLTLWCFALFFYMKTDMKNDVMAPCFILKFMLKSCENSHNFVSNPWYMFVVCGVWIDNEFTSVWYVFTVCEYVVVSYLFYKFCLWIINEGYVQFLPKNAYYDTFLRSSLQNLNLCLWKCIGLWGL